MSAIELPSATIPAQSSVRDMVLPDADAHSPFISLEFLAYLLLGILSLVVHLWALGDRSLHHDETLHATYSWNIYTGKGYIHDPLLHGPFLYYFGAAIFFLFGDSDFTARLGAALFGTILTLLPFLLRRDLGRSAALMASVYLLISPTFLYVGRFIRHDIYSVVFEMLIFVAIVRYAATRQAAWLYLGAAAFGLMLTNQETSYLFLLLMGTPLIIALLWRVYRPGIVILASLAVALALLVFILPGTARVDGSHNAIRDPDTGLMEYTGGPIFGWYPLETSDNAYALRVRNRPDDYNSQSLLMNIGGYVADVWKFFQHPAILISLSLGLSTTVLLIWLIWFAPNRNGLSAWQRARTADDPVVEVFASLAVRWRWFVALGIFLAIYTLLFTAFLTNRLGIITGTTGSLLYWLAQHDVERGGQPGYYYLVLLFIYEPLLLFWGAIGGMLVAKDLLRRKRGTATPDRPAYLSGVRLTPLLLVWWSAGALGIYSWAGEKMPWLSIHVALPMVLLSAWACQRVFYALRERLRSEGNGFAGQFERNSWRPGLLFSIGFALVVILGFLLMTIYTAVAGQAQLQLSQVLVDVFGIQQIPAWIIPVLVLFLLILLTVIAALQRGWRWSVCMLTVCITLLGSIYTVRNSLRLSFQNGDVPREMLIYTQTSPDVMHVVRRLEEASRRRGGGLDMPVLYDNETVWLWYMRNFRQSANSGQQLSGPPSPDVQAVLMLQENLSRFPENREYLADFRMQRLPLRWWFPEDAMYRLRGDWRTQPVEEISLVGRVLRAPFDSETIVRMWDYLIYRDTRNPLGSTDFVIAVRPVVADQIGLGLGAELDNP